MNGRDQHKVSVLGRCLSCRQSNKRTKEWQGPTLGARFREVLLYREVKKMTSEWQALTVAVCFRELFIL